MPSLAESKRQVRDGLQSHNNEVDHDAILASLQDEIDRHNSRDEDRQSSDDSKRRRRGDRKDDGSSLKFRFKSGTSDPRDRKRRHHRHRDSGRGHRKSRKSKHESEEESEGAAHPFPREPIDFERDATADSTAAFRDSLFDALADDEGAAYWESVYSQPIHVYARPTVENEQGELVQMNDEQYAAYVQTKMWEKKNPHIVLERERKEKQRREEEEERTRQREDFIRRKQRAAWERAERQHARKFAGVDDEDYEYVFDFEGKTGGASARTSNGSSQHEYGDAWKRYAAAWDALKKQLLEQNADSKSAEPSKRMPWPVLQSKPVIKPNIEDFMRHVPLEKDGPSRVQIYKSERVKWHPDKVQQRFQGKVDEGTMKLVTGIFQVVDALLEQERKRSDAA
ncbi:hypothetical protein AC579_881 [Pseudocercospora musae]|uniref:Uncharacterized protein n=1 Tax=Pseudocercospora musae TaxID=113226 RepID=A0A139INJ4_9PEZI|nr:hypothetical protein AC579_881 [Pseudocercospora musae]